MTEGMTRSEAFVTWLCQRTFLRLWTHPTPIGKKGKELCDCLVVCGPHVIIVSVKEIQYRDTGDKVGWERWHKAAIEESAQQISGAQRWLESAERILRKDGREIALPPKNERRYHRLAVSLGGRGQVPLRWGDFGKGFIHVLDELALTETFHELTTVSDFVDYLSAAENLIARGVRPIIESGGAEDLLALYARNGPSFGIIQPDGSAPDVVLIQEGLWKALTESPEYIERNKSLEGSYAWDRLIEHFVNDLLTGGMFDLHSKLVTQNELALVAMALQPRAYRASLAEALISFIGPAGSGIASRAAVAANSTAFVFTTGDSSDRDHRARELALRCWVVRGNCNVTTVVGIATDRPGPGKAGHSSDIVYLHIPTWTAENAEMVEKMQKELGFFKSTKWGPASCGQQQE